MFHTIVSIKNDGHYFCRAGGNRPDGLNEPVTVDAFVKKVISGPYEEYGKWWIDVEYISWGVPGKTRLMFDSKEQALEVKEGYKFLT
ncbi:hypothetical protein DN352_21485 [Salmonella enterica subsp. enterica serovar Saintpaul]|nr:hypothetical protein [Salmonella enterica subsp. enterica serovar Saintpaul]